MVEPRPSTPRLRLPHLVLLAALTPVATGAVAVPLQRGGDLGAVTSGDHLYVGQGATVVTIASDGTGSPQILDVTAPLPGLVRGLAIHEDILFATWRSGEPSGQLALFSLADPAQPAWIANIPYSDGEFLSPGGLAVVGTTLFLVDSEIGLLPIDVSNPEEPVIGTPFTTFGLRGVAQYDASHLIAWGRSFIGGLNVSVFDITTPSAPLELATYAGGNQFDVALGDGFMVLTGQGFEVVDLSDPANPTLLASRPDAHGFTGAVVDGHLLLGWEDAIHVWDLSDPSAPSELPPVPAAADRTRLMAPGPVAGETFLLTDTARALAVDTTIAGAPAVQAVLDLPVGVDSTAAADNGTVVFLSDFYSGLRVVDPALGSVARLDPPASSQPAFEDVAIDGSLALLSDWSFGIHVVDIGDPAAPTVLGSVSLAFATAAVFDGDRAWAVTSTGGGTVVGIDLSDPTAPQITSSTPISKGLDLFRDGTHLYVADEIFSDTGGLRIFDISGTAPVPVAHYTVCDSAGGVEVREGLAALACHNGELHLLDVSDPAAPVQIGVYSDDSIFMQGSAALIDGSRAYFGYSAGLDIVDISDPANPTLIERFEIPGGVRDLGHAAGGGAWVAAGTGGTALVQPAGAEPVLSFDPASLEFGDVEVGTTSPPQTAMLTNTGDADATGIAFSGLPDAGFTADTGACGDTLPAGETCAVTVTFTPAVPGPATAVLHVDSAEGAMADLGLSGNGVGGGEGPIADITPDAFSFEVPQGGGDSGTLSIGNLGDADLTWSLEEAEAAAELVPQGAPYRYGLAETPEFHAPVGSDRAAAAGGGRPTRRSAASDDTGATDLKRPASVPADRVVLPAPQTAAIGSLTEGFDDITQLPGAGWALINNSEPVGPTSWFQGNDSIFPAHEGDPDAYIAANFESTADSGTISNWLITPEVTIVNGTSITFWTRKAELFEQFADRMEVRMSVEGDSTDVGDSAESVGVFTEVLLTINPDLIPGEYPQEWTQFTLTVRGRSRRPVTGRFAFRYWVTDSGPDGTNGDYIGIDTVSVTQPGDPPPGGCDNPVDVSWLAADPTSGTTAPGGSVPVTVTVDAADLEVGEYTADLCVATNDPAAPLVNVPVSLTVTDGGTTFVETFDGGGNAGNWTFGIPPIEIIESDGGNPDGWLHSTCEKLDCLDTFAPQLRTTPMGDVNEFTGNYRERGVTSVGVDLQTLYVDFSAEGRPLTVLLMQDNGTPDDSSDDWAAYFIGEENVPLVGEGWKSFSFDIPSDALELPAGWQFIQFGGNAPPDPDWNVVIENVSQLRYFYGDPELFYIFQQWELGLDNARITSTTPNPDGSGPGVEPETSKEKRDVEGKLPVRSHLRGRGAVRGEAVSGILG